MNYELMQGSVEGASQDIFFWTYKIWISNTFPKEESE